MRKAAVTVVDDLTDVPEMVEDNAGVRREVTGRAGTNAIAYGQVQCEVASGVRRDFGQYGGA